MKAVYGLCAGMLLGIVVVRAVRRRPVAAQQKVFAVALLVAALIYAAFAALGGAESLWLTYELGGVALFGGLALLGRRYAIVLAGAWAGHVFWDVLLHLGTRPGAAYTPDWYPWLCVSFDLLLAAVIGRNAALGQP